MEFRPDMIIWSADVTKTEIENVINSGALPYGTMIKLDRLFFERESKDFIHFCENSGYPVFCDAKIIEIPAKALAIAESYLEYRPTMLNIMAGACSTGNWTTDDINNLDALKRFAEACHDAAVRSCIVTVLTSKSDRLVDLEYGTSAIDQVLTYVKMAHHAGFTDIVCSPKEAAIIRKSHAYNNIWLNTPGVRPKGSNADDQQRITTPGQAFKNGANRVVIGRPLLAGEGPISERIANNYASIRKEIETAIKDL